MKVLAAFIFFTRLPFWRIKEVPAKYFKRIVPYWPLAGWLTGGITVGVLWIAAQILPISIAWVLAILSRLLITGCLHEDGLADFFGRKRKGNFSGNAKGPRYSRSFQK